MVITVVYHLLQLQMKKFTSMRAWAQTFESAHATEDGNQVKSVFVCVGFITVLWVYPGPNLDSHACIILKNKDKM